MRKNILSDILPEIFIKNFNIINSKIFSPTAIIHKKIRKVSCDKDFADSL